jgi:nucleotide-binding universal stress UspA family protein
MDSAHVPAGSIVIGIDGSPTSEAALSWAADQAALEKRQLTIVHAVEPMGFPSAGVVVGSTGVDYGRLLYDTREAARAVLTSASARALDAHPQLAVQEVLKYSDPRSALLGLGETAAMIVIGSRGRGPVSSLLLGSVSVSVSKHAGCPVVVHRPALAETPRSGILVGVDGSDCSLPAIEFAYRMASWRGLPLSVLHCFWAPSPSCAPHGAGVPDLAGEEALVAESLAGMQEKFPEVKVQLLLDRGFADQRLISATSDYDLLVVGHHPIPLLNDLVYGSVAPTVVEHAHGAVAVVPSRPNGPA